MIASATRVGLFWLHELQLPNAHRLPISGYAAEFTDRLHGGMVPRGSVFLIELNTDTRLSLPSDEASAFDPITCTIESEMFGTVERYRKFKARSEQEDKANADRTVAGVPEILGKSPTVWP